MDFCQVEVRFIGLKLEPYWLKKIYVYLVASCIRKIKNNSPRAANETLIWLLQNFFFARDSSFFFRLSGQF